MKKIYAGSLAVWLLLVSCVFAVLSVNAADAVEDSWETMASMPTARMGPGLAVVNGKIYAIGGYNGSHVNINEMYNPAANTWITKKSMPTLRSFATAVFHNKIYCIGGADGLNEVYDPATDTWETKQPMPTPRSALSASVVNDKIYLIGGFVPSSIGLPQPERTNLNEMYDPVTDSWTTMAPLPTDVAYTISTVVDNKIYVFGNTGEGNNQVQIYDPQTNTWRYGPSVPYSVAYGAGAATTGVCAAKKIYLIGGGSINQIFDPETETWSTGASMPTPRNFFSVAVVDDLLYAIGGENLSGMPIIYDVNERYTPFGYVSTVPPPEITLTSPENKTYCNTSVPLEFSVNKQVFWLWYKLDGENDTEIAGNTTLTGLTSGVHNITVYAADSAGNVGASQTIHFTITPEQQQQDTEPFPTVPVAAVSATSAVAVGAGLIVYFKKHRRHPSPRT
jgi:N-acetylneuraminic acid mutarotase